MGVAYVEREAGRCSVLFVLDDGRQLTSSSEVVSIRIILTMCYQIIVKSFGDAFTSSEHFKENYQEDNSFSYITARFNILLSSTLFQYTFMKLTRYISNYYI